MAQPVEDPFQVEAFQPQAFEVIRHAPALLEIFCSSWSRASPAGQRRGLFLHLPDFIFLGTNFMDQFQHPGLLGGQVQGVLFTEIVQAFWGASLSSSSLFTSPMIALKV